MSLKNFFAHLWATVKHLFDGLAKEVKELAPVIIDIIQGIKNAEGSGLVDLLGMLIPGHWSDELKGLANKWIPQILTDLDIANATASIADPIQRAEAMLSHIKLASDDQKDMFWHSFASKLMEKMNGGTLGWGDAALFSQLLYKAVYGKDLPADQTPTQLPADPRGIPAK